MNLISFIKFKIRSVPDLLSLWDSFVYFVIFFVHEVCKKIKYFDCYENHLRRVKIKSAFNAGTISRQNEPCVSFETFSASVYHGNHTGVVQFSVIVIQKWNQHAVYPPPGNYRIQSRNHDMKLSVKWLVLILDLAKMWHNIAAFNSFVYKLCSTFCLGWSYVLVTKQELPKI